MTKKIAFCAMLSALGILSLILANVLQANTIFLYLFSTLFCYIATEECGLKYGFITYAVVTLLGFFLVANKMSMLGYAVMVGYYPVVKHVIEHWNLAKLWKWCLKLLFAGVVSFFAYGIAKQLIRLPFVLLLFGGAVLFVIYDMALTIGIRFYVLRLRKWKP